MTESNDKISFGEILRSKREDLKIEIAEVSAHLRVKQSDIEAIEKNLFHKITKHIYGPGLIRTYAKFLKLDSRIIEEQIKLLPFGSNVENKEHVLINLEEDDDLSPSKIVFLNALAASILLISLFFLIYNFREKKSDLLPNSKLISQLKSALSDEE
jgi:cytoskeletal protein RodZ